MRHAQRARIVRGVGPVGKTRQDRAGGTGQADGERGVRPGVRGTAAKFERVEHGGDRPGADGHVGDHGVQRMPQRAAMQEVLDGNTSLGEEFYNDRLDASGERGDLRIAA
jgi:hypothetical protein